MIGLHFSQTLRHWLGKKYLSFKIIYMIYEIILILIKTTIIKFKSGINHL
jgi:hypothetical protein